MKKVMLPWGYEEVEDDFHFELYDDEHEDFDSDPIEGEENEVW